MLEAILLLYYQISINLIMPIKKLISKNRDYSVMQQVETTTKFEKSMFNATEIE